MILTQRGRPVAMLKSLDDDSHVKTRLCQYEAYGNEKGVYIAKQIVLSKMKGQNLLLSKHGFNPHDPKIADSVERVRPNSIDKARGKLVSIEGKYTQQYFRQILQLLPEKLRPESRKKFKAYDGINNTFNLAYEILSWKVHRALIKAKLEPYLGFLHSVQFGKPSLVCDFQELYRYLLDDFLIQYCQRLGRKDLSRSEFLMPVDGHVGKVFCRTGMITKVIHEGRVDSSKRWNVILASKMRNSVQQLVQSHNKDTIMVDHGAFQLGLNCCPDNLKGICCDKCTKLTCKVSQPLTTETRCVLGDFCKRNLTWRAF